MNKKNIIIITILGLMLVLIIVYVNKSDTQTTNNTVPQTITHIPGQTQISNTTNDTVIVAKNDNEDLVDTFTESSSNLITLNNESITIDTAGTYIVSGTLTNGQIIVNAKNTDTVRMILNGVNITSTNSAPIFIMSADKTIITIAAGTQNYLTDSKNYILDSEEEPTATIFSKDDLVINGTGNLSISANYNDAITSKDDLTIVNGNINIVSVDDGIVGKDSVYIKGGNINISAVGNGIKSTNDTEADKGYIVIDAGTINITKSNEGLESKIMQINGGTIDIVATDDGVNGTGTNAKIEINGGNININARGDGIDSNGSIYMTGGYVVVNGPTDNGNGSLDYDGKFEITGGTLIAAGSSGMVQNASTPTIYGVSIYYTSSIKANTVVTIKDSSGNVIIKVTPIKAFQSLIVYSPDFKKGETYSIYSDDTLYSSFTATNYTTTVGTSSNNRGRER